MRNPSETHKVLERQLKGAEKRNEPASHNSSHVPVQIENPHPEVSLLSVIPGIQPPRADSSLGRLLNKMGREIQTHKCANHNTKRQKAGKGKTTKFLQISRHHTRRRIQMFTCKTSQWFQREHKQANKWIRAIQVRKLTKLMSNSAIWVERSAKCETNSLMTLFRRKQMLKIKN